VSLHIRDPLNVIRLGVSLYCDAAKRLFLRREAAQLDDYGEWE
jgi:hypothetical protein